MSSDTLSLEAFDPWVFVTSGSLLQRNVLPGADPLATANMLHVQQSRADHTVSILLRNDDVLRIGSRTFSITTSPPEEVQVNSSIPNQQSTPDKPPKKTNHYIELQTAIVTNDLVQVSRSMREDDRILHDSAPEPSNGKLIEETPAKKTNYRDALDSQMIESMEVDEPFVEPLETPESESLSVNSLAENGTGTSIKVEDESQLLNNYDSSPPLGHDGNELNKSLQDTGHVQQTLHSPPNPPAHVLGSCKIDSMPKIREPLLLGGTQYIPLPQLEIRRGGARQLASEQNHVDEDQLKSEDGHPIAVAQAPQKQQNADEVPDGLSKMKSKLPRVSRDFDQVTAAEMVVLPPKPNGGDHTEPADENERLSADDFQRQVHEAVVNSEHLAPSPITPFANAKLGRARKGQVEKGIKSRKPTTPVSAITSTHKRKISTEPDTPSVDLRKKKKNKTNVRSQDEGTSTITATPKQSRLHDGISDRIKSKAKAMSTSTPNSSASSIKRKVTRFSPSTMPKAYTGSKPRAVFSNSTIPNRPHIMRFFSVQGGKEVNKITENGYDILVVGDNHLKKTSKLLLSIALGKPIVTDAWVIQSSKAEKLLDTDPFVPDDPEREEEWGFTLREANSRNNRRSLFSGKILYFTPALKKEYGSSFKEIEGLMKVVGADHVISKPPRELDEDDGPNIIAVGLEHGDLDVVGLLEHKRTCFNKDLLSLSILRGKLDLESDEFRIVLSGSQQKKNGKQRKNG